HMTKLHPGSVVIPAALAIGEKEHIDGISLITAVVSGYETMTHVSRGANPAASRLRGWHLTGTCGTFGAAAAAGKIWQFDAQTMACALGMAGTQSAGLWAFTADGSHSKRFHPGRSSQSGIIAASLAQRGYRGPTKILEAEDGGFYKATSNGFSFSRIFEGLGERFDTQNVAIKPYPACGSLHSSIDAVLSLRKEYRIDTEKVKKINVYNSEVVNVQCGFDYSPMGPLQGQMSLKYCVARALMDGMLSALQFKDEKLSEPAVVDLAGRVNFIKHDEIDRIYPRKFPSIVEIIMDDGKTYKLRVDFPKGSKQNPMTWKEVEVKFRINVSDVISERKAVEIIDLVKNLEKIKDVSKLTCLLKA
ncbi:MAG: MmgE/PrpD family protein, partial [Deltaproteobacteria bacterium]|nr:MmgE/PrpD family protein [Deltaproteobacteria bacterium]